MNKMIRLAAWGAVFCAASLAACGANTLQVEEAWARPGLAAGNSAVYFVVDNPTNEPDTLLSASADVAERIELHLSVMQDDTMRMLPQKSIPVDAKSRVTFKPGGLHVMLIKLEADLKRGDSFPLKLDFEKSGEIIVDVLIKEP